MLDCFNYKKRRAHHFSERLIFANENRLDYPHNGISTSKYNVINFLPKNLFFQFCKLANVYFVLIGLLQLVPEISTSNGKPYIFVPLVFIIAITMLKDFVEDYKRHKSDWEENNKKVKVMRNGQLVPARWRELRVGNIIKVEENQSFPADVLIVHSSGKKGICFVETKNLDGETNLKQKQAHKEIIADFETEAKASRAKNQFKFEKPNDYLYKFVGSINTSTGSSVPMGEQNFVLRGCSLRNTEHVLGIVAYTGHNTKIMLNSIKAKAKFSKLERTMNKQITLVFLVQIMFCIFSGLYAAIWYSSKEDEVSYLAIDRTGVKDNTFIYNFIVRFGNWLLIFTNFVPISLLVTLEMVKLFQGIYMTYDEEMTSKYDNVKTTVQTSNLNEELGQVEYIFSDKTGTLTKNIMEFKNLSVREKSYGDSRTLKDTKGMPKVTNVDFLDKEFMDELNNPKAPNYENIMECITLLAVCHTIITDEKEGQVVYDASSPDELALVNFAKFVGAEFLGMDEDNHMTINLKGKTLKFQLLHVLEFNSTRKRMSVIVKQQDGKIVLYTKGADTVLFERMNKNDSALSPTQTHLQTYATQGLRTLVLAKRVIDTVAYASWAKRYHDASIKIEGRDEAMDALQSEIEQDLRLVGATAIEDKLQDEVGETISKLKEAGIKVWVLTGDKVETAINIGYSCKLLSDDLVQLHVTQKSFAEVSACLDEKINLIKKTNLEQAKFALIISGEALFHAMKPELSKKIMMIGEICRAVLACRVSPKQKQEIVSLVRREKPTTTTLAIGDGANDVYMITAASVGVGIKGVEGQQAARASDFAIGEFKILRRLLLFHGREAYRRNSYLILYNFYKNMVLVLPQFWFAFVSAFSGTVMYDQVIYQFFNMFFTSVPIIIYAVFDEEYSPKTLVNSPNLYVQGMQSKLFNTVKFWRWFTLGIWESGVITLISFGAIDNNFSTNESGRLLGYYGPGMLAFSIAVWVCNFKILSMSHTFHVLNNFCVFGSMLTYLLIFCIASLTSYTSTEGFFSSLFGTVDFYIGSVLAVVVSIAFYMAYHRYQVLKRMTFNKKISPEEAEIQKLLDAAAAIPIDLSLLKPTRKDSDDSKYDNSKNLVGFDPKVIQRNKYSGFAFSGTENNKDLMNARG